VSLFVEFQTLDGNVSPRDIENMLNAIMIGQFGAIHVDIKRYSSYAFAEFDKSAHGVAQAKEAFAAIGSCWGEFVWGGRLTIRVEFSKAFAKFLSHEARQAVSLFPPQHHVMMLPEGPGPSMINLEWPLFNSGGNNAAYYLMAPCSLSDHGHPFLLPSNPPILHPTAANRYLQHHLHFSASATMPRPRY